MQSNGTRRRNSRMTSCESCGGHATTLVLQGANVALLGKVMQQQERDGRAAVALIESAQVALPKGAPEPGKGRLVDVVG